MELEVLDLEKEAGGLTVFRQVGGMQTPGLAFTGVDLRRLRPGFFFAGSPLSATTQFLPSALAR